MNIAHGILSLILPGLMLIVLTCTCRFDPSDNRQIHDDNETTGWGRAVDDIKSLTRNKPIPGHLIDPDQPLTEDLFDPNQLLVPLHHLHLRSGYVLDFVYHYDGMGGLPFLYARKETQPPFEDFDAYQKAIDDCASSTSKVGCNYLDYVESDGTEEGYFQWVILRMMGDQFYLNWHANYDDSEIVANKAQLETLIEKLSGDDSGKPLSSAQKKAAIKIDPAPVVTIDGEIVKVRIVWFTKWGGFYESNITLNSGTPHKVIDTQTQLLVEYDCQILF